MLNESKKKEELPLFYRTLKNGYVSVKGDFLLPPEYDVGHTHKWITLDAGYCVCQLCGLDHVCFQGKCPVVSMEHSEEVCSISGCVILKTEMRPEWGAVERTTGVGKMLLRGEEEDTSRGYTTSNRNPNNNNNNNNVHHNYYDEDNNDMESSPKRRRNEHGYIKSTDTFAGKNNVQNVQNGYG